MPIQDGKVRQVLPLYSDHSAANHLWDSGKLTPGGKMATWREIPGNPKIFDDLVELMKTGEAVGFVGAGASAGLYPLWPQLIEQLADAAVDAGKANEDAKRIWCQRMDSLQAARLIRRALGEGTFAEQIREIFGPKMDPDGRRFTKIHRVLAQLAFRAFVTSNFDPALTLACRHHRPGTLVQDFDWRSDRVGLWLQGRRSMDGELPILHSHGKFDAKESLVLDAEDFRRTYTEDRFRLVFEQLWTRERLVVVGFSFGDPWFQIVVDEALTRAGARSVSAPRHIAILGLPEADMASAAIFREQLEDPYHLRVLFYPLGQTLGSDGKEQRDHSALGHLLDELTEATTIPSATRPSPPPPPPASAPTPPTQSSSSGTASPQVGKRPELLSSRKPTAPSTTHASERGIGIGGNVVQSPLISGDHATVNIFPPQPSAAEAPGKLPAEEPESHPNQMDAATRELSEYLSTLYTRRETALISGQPIEELDREILQVRRQIRQGPVLQPEEFLGEGRYRLVEQIGKGGFGEVWKAWDTRNQRLIALKCLHGQYSQDQTRRERFFRGARKMDELAHPHIVRVLEAKGSEDGWNYFAMEYLSGGDFEQAVLNGALDAEARLRIVQEAGKALAYAHRKGVVHRDIKPSNILLDEAGRAKLTDFDLVTAGNSTGGTKTHAMLGTINFAAPEALLSAKDAGPAADVYSLAVTTIFAIQGQALSPLFFRNPEAAIAHLACNEMAQNVLRRALADDPAQRHSSAREFCEDLKKAMAEVSVGKPNALKIITQPKAKVEQDDLRLPQALNEREKAFEDIPKRLQSAEACIAFVEQKKEGCRNGFDLFWLWWIIEEVERRWGPSLRSQTLLENFFDHIPQPKNPELLSTLDSPRDGKVPLWRKVPSGEGQVGSPGDEDERRDNEGPMHRIEIVRPYWLGCVPVTNAQYALLDPERPYGARKEFPLHPRVHITWYEAVSFCRWLATQPGFEGSMPRLPAEEEWEYACRAESTTRFWFGSGEEHLNEVGWYEANSGARTRHVGEKSPNKWGLYDLHGNVWEWTTSPWDAGRYKNRPQEDIYRIDPTVSPADLAGAPRAVRVVRGGSYWDSARRCRSACRGIGNPGAGFKDRGFRVLLSSAPKRP